MKTKRLSAREKKWKKADAEARAKIVEALKEENPKALAILFDGYEQAFIGLSHRYGQPPLVVYSYKKCIEINMKRDGMDYDGAVEWFEYNAMRTWAGKHTPIILQDMNND
jgi:hypothetical protein